LTSPPLPSSPFFFGIEKTRKEKIVVRQAKEPVRHEKVIRLVTYKERQIERNIEERTRGKK